MDKRKSERQYKCDSWYAIQQFAIVYELKVEKKNDKWFWISEYKYEWYFRNSQCIISLALFFVWVCACAWNMVAMEAVECHNMQTK